MKINELIESASHDMFNPELNFEIAKEYERINQTASAVSFYLRAAEYGYETHPLIVYTSLLRMSICFEDQKDRNWTVSNCILQAISHIPSRPEGYFFLARFHERSGNWQECYTMSEIGLSFSQQKLEPLPADVDYPGEYVLRFEKGVSAWWIGRKDESSSIFESLIQEPNVLENYKNACRSNLEKMNAAV
jgi:hypothetical protein